MGARRLGLDGVLTDSYKRRLAEAILVGFAVLVAFTATVVGRSDEDAYFLGDRCSS